MPGHQRTKITIQNGKPKSNRKWGKTSAHNSTAKRKIQRQRQGVKQENQQPKYVKRCQAAVFRYFYCRRFCLFLFSCTFFSFFLYFYSIFILVVHPHKLRGTREVSQRQKYEICGHNIHIVEICMYVCVYSCCVRVKDEQNASNTYASTTKEAIKQQPSASSQTGPANNFNIFFRYFFIF